MSQAAVYESRAGRVIVMDSIAYLNEQNEGDVIVCGSHGGRSAAEHAVKFKPKAVIFNDAGKGKEKAGISGLDLLNEQGIMGATVDTMSARIGEGLDSYNSGIISAMNERALQTGVKIGMPAKEAAMNMLALPKSNNPGFPAVQILFSLIAIGSWILSPGFAYPGPKGEVRVCQALTEPLTLDPHMHHNVETEDITRQICEHLIDRDANGKLVPSLATDWQLLNDFTWQFKLRKGVRFHNGEEFNSESVKFSIERIISPDGKSPQKRFYDSIDHVNLIDDHTLNIITNRIDVLLPSRLSSFFGNIVPIRYFKEVGDAGFARHPVGTGPFRFFNWEKGKEIILIPNNLYWGDIPNINKLSFKFVSDPDEQLTMLRNGDLDIIINVSPLNSLALKKKGKTNISIKPTTQYIVFQMNTLKDGPLKKREVRIALNYGINSSNLIKYVYKGNAIRLATNTTPEEFGFNPKLKPYSFDPARAKDLLEKAGFKNGFSLNLLTFADLHSVGIAIKNELASVGVEANIKLISRNEYIKKIMDKSLDFDAVIGNPSNPFFDAMVHLDLFFNSKSSFARYQNKEIDDLLIKASQSSDPFNRKLILMKIQEIIFDEAPCLFLFQNIRIYGSGENISNFVPYADGLLRLNSIIAKE